MTFAIKIEIPNAGAIINALRVEALTELESIRGINESTLAIRERMIERSPFGGTGELRESWQSEPAKNVEFRKVSGRTVSLGAGGIKALSIDQGAKQHFPPIDPVPALDIWIRRKLGITNNRKVQRAAFKIGQKFKRRGKKGIKLFTKNFERMESQITAIMQRAVDSIIQKAINF